MKKFFTVIVCVVACLSLNGCFYSLEDIEAYNKEVQEYNAMIEAQKSTPTPIIEETLAPTVAPTAEPTPEPTPIPTPEVISMKTQFKNLGFTDVESEKMQEIFTTVGITEISNIQSALGSGIDNLQSFKCDIYDYHANKGGISVRFTVDKRQLCFISLDGIPTTKTDYAYINIFGNVKFKTSNGTQSVTLYDKWDENGEIDNNAVGYIAVFDYNNKKITKYEK